MPSQKLHILNIPELDNIINEIKEFLNFDLIKTNNINDLINEINLGKGQFENSLFLLEQKDLEVIKKHVDLSKVCLLPNKPLRIFNLLELINVKFIRQVYNSQSNVILKGYNLDLNTRTLKKGKKKLKLTEREIDTIMFLQKNNKPTSIETLQKEVWKYVSDLETHTVETHIYRLRKKINDNFNDDKFIFSEKSGYLI